MSKSVPVASVSGTQKFHIYVYFIVINKEEFTSCDTLTNAFLMMQLKEYIVDTEDVINIELVRYRQLCICFLSVRWVWIDFSMWIVF